jgi:hypothetical protein
MKNKNKISSKVNCTVGVGILSWKSYKTLEKSLQSYEKVGFKDLFDEVKIIFQEISEEDKALAKKYGYDYVGTSENLGIQNGHKLIHDNLSTDYVLVLENDNPVVEDDITVLNRFLKAIELLEKNKIDVMRLRHRWNFGESFSLEKYLEYYDVRELHEKYCAETVKVNAIASIIKFFKRKFRTEKALRIAGYGLYYEKNPNELFPDLIEKIEDELFVANSRIMTWTNQSVLLKHKFYGELLKYAEDNPSSRTANGFQDLEKPLNSKWWRNSNFKIGIGEGLFSHDRFDDSWRKSHHAYNDVILENKKDK